MKKEEFQQNMKDRMQQFEDGGLRLLKKGQKGIVHAIFSRFGLVLLLMLLQVGVLWSVFRWFGGLLPHYFGGSVAMSAFMVVYILNSEMDNSAKITWMVTIAILPVVGVPLFFYVKSNIGHNALKKRVTHLTEEARGLQPQPLAAAQELAEADPGAASLARYLHGKGGGFSVYRNTEVTPAARPSSKSCCANWKRPRSISSSSTSSSTRVSCGARSSKCWPARPPRGWTSG